ncbi:hypothetical protein [Deinococcus aquatilis]|jgi:hypothetical protein|uniref:hypothetical protein n=1 Tax=Deinococcus aquatilis TaxID=519440 RepID=UPI00036C94D8|nr:hypothetical protein [Deinococcus aquatilis]
MSLKDSFTPEEWFKVMSGPGRAGAVIVAASPSGITGIVAEARAIGDAIREQVSGPGRTPLLEAMAADLIGTPPDPKTLPQPDRARNMDEARQQGLEAVRQAVWLVSAKASPEDSAAYRNLLMVVAQRTAEAAKEGGFLGIGGELVNDKERAALAELRELLRLDEVEATSTPVASINPDGSGNSP